MHVEESRPTRRAASGARKIAVRILTLVVGVAFMGLSAYWGFRAVRVYLEPSTPVRLSCSGINRFTCPATWTIDGRQVQGTASDDFSGHHYSRFIRHSDNAVLRMHVSGTKATMNPDWWTIPTAIFGLFWGAAIVSAPYRRRWRRGKH